MSVNGGGGRIRGGSSSERRNGSLAGMNEATTGGKGSGPYSHGIQVIDENKEFTPDLPAYLAEQNLIAAGFAYHVVAVFGSQSTGKSTLLNHLFGTQFSVMDEQARRQTTKGIWMSRAIEDNEQENSKGMRKIGSDGIGKNILVMDVEGTDGRERGEDQDFERKSALFALATSEVLIVNIWEHQVGLYQGANMGLLKTVFEVNLGLFLKGRSTTHRSLLFFVIRDHIGHTPLVNLSTTLLQDLNRIWSSLAKPPGLENSQIDDFFDFDFVALPHKFLQPEKFVEETQRLRRRFRDGVPSEGGVKQFGDDEGIFLPAYHRRIPADGFPLYAEGVWEQIVTNKDLDLPSQQELLAQFRCDEIAATCTTGFNDIISPFEEQAKAGKVLGGLGDAMKRALGEAMGEFEESGGRYHKGVFGRKKVELKEKLEGRLRGLVVGQFSALSKRAVQEFTEEITSVLKTANSSGQSASNYDFASAVNTTRAKVIDRFIAEATESNIPGAEWSNYENELTSLQSDLDEIAARLRGEEMKRLVSRLEKAIRIKLAEPVELEFRRMEENSAERGGLWDRVWEVWTGVVCEGVDGFLARAGSFNATESERDVGAWRLKKRAWGVLKSKIEEEVMEGNLLLKLRENFEDRFRYDEQGVPRVWRPNDPIEQTYTAAREATLKLIPLVAHIRFSSGQEPPLAKFLGEPPEDFEEDVDELGHTKVEFEVLSESKQVDLSTRFKRMADAVFVEAKRSTVSSVAEIPLYFWGLMLALGWNEIWAVLRSPVYFVFLLLCCALAYAVYTLNLWGPIIRVTNAMGQQAMDIGKERLRDFLVTDQNLAYPARVNRTRSHDDDDSDAINLQTLDGAGKRRPRIKQEDDE